MADLMPNKEFLIHVSNDLKYNWGFFFKSLLHLS